MNTNEQNTPYASPLEEAGVIAMEHIININMAYQRADFDAVPDKHLEMLQEIWDAIHGWQDAWRKEVKNLVGQAAATVASPPPPEDDAPVYPNCGDSGRLKSRPDVLNYCDCKAAKVLRFQSGHEVRCNYCDGIRIEGKFVHAGNCAYAIALLQDDAPEDPRLNWTKEQVSECFISETYPRCIGCPQASNCSGMHD